MKETMARALLVLSVFGLWREGCMSFFWLLCMSVAAWTWLTMLDGNRSPHRTPISVILARIFGGIWILCFVLLNTWDDASGSQYWTFWRISGCALTATVVIVAWYWFLSWRETQMVKDDPQYLRWKATGGHYFFDSLPRVVNPDSDFIRQGGIPEPDYTGFAPPSHWQYQCPVCGARVQFAVDVCWNCSYGADGDWTAYFERWGNLDPRPPSEG